MNIPDDEKTLTELFRKLGARDPESWASSQVTEGIPQLQRFLWLREAWKLVVPHGDVGWIDAYLAHARKQPNDPHAGVARALQECMDKGVAKETLSHIVRGMQAELLFGVCYLFDDPNFPEDEVKDLSWGLFETDEDGNPIARIYALHESVQETDPAGDEMRPDNKT